ncbi:Hypothetical predicted protein [Paramuricea clavata]|uniref:Uncharacterized protein n=1 Tax=Paramuricea clavata TaxID=317549 RepID=A0A7D9EID1_PARCT|nr:Hypothetical predicted protein [Paramuricea clavata]
MYYVFFNLPEKHPKEFGNHFHALDVWHKSIKLLKKLAKAPKVKNCEAVAEWSEAIRNHFWFVRIVMVMKRNNSCFGVLHHIAGEHEWADGECTCGPLVATEVGKTCLDKNSKAFKEIHKVVLDQRFLKSFHQYVTFRHTNKLENFNSMLLKYAPKRVGYQ